MMRTVGIFEAKTKLSELIEAVKRGEEIRITQRGKPVARLVVDNEVGVQIEKPTAVEMLAQVREDLRQKGMGMTLEDILSGRDEGRR
jgi:antitoxin (DNA-binding transcriptional repressor) of toxin-antitoxin stability system